MRLLGPLKLDERAFHPSHSAPPVRSPIEVAASLRTQVKHPLGIVKSLCPFFYDKKRACACLCMRRDQTDAGKTRWVQCVEHLSGLRAAWKEVERERLAAEQRAREAAEALAALERARDEREKREAEEAALEAARRAQEEAAARQRERADTQAKLRVSPPSFHFDISIKHSHTCRFLNMTFFLCCHFVYLIIFGSAKE